MTLSCHQAGAGTGHSPTASRKPLSTCRQDIFPAAFLNLVSAPFSAGVCKPHRGCPLFTCPWWPRGLEVLSSKGLLPSEKQFLAGQHSRALSAQSSLKKAYLSRSSSLRNRLQVSHTTSSHKGTPREHKRGDIILAHPTGLTTAQRDLPERSLYACLELEFLQSRETSWSGGQQGL